MIDMSKYTERARIEGNYIVTGYNKNEKKINKEIEPSYDLGYVFGSYLSVGNVNLVTYNNSTRGIVFWYVESVDSHERISQLKHSLKNSFNLSFTQRKQKKASTYQLVCYSKPLATLLSTFGKKSGLKSLPNEYLFLNEKEYRKGLIKGIEDFNGHLPDPRDVLKKRKLSINVVNLYNMLKNY